MLGDVGCHEYDDCVHGDTQARVVFVIGAFLVALAVYISTLFFGGSTHAVWMNARILTHTIKQTGQAQQAAKVDRQSNGAVRRHTPRLIPEHSGLMGTICEHAMVRRHRVFSCLSLLRRSKA